MKSITRKLTDLTHREYEIYMCLRKGMKSKEIACKLFISKNTVDTHRRRILAKLRNSQDHTLYRALI